MRGTLTTGMRGTLTTGGDRFRCEGSYPLALPFRGGSYFRGDRIRCDTGAEVCVGYTARPSYYTYTHTVSISSAHGRLLERTRYVHLLLIITHQGGAAKVH